MKLPDPRRPPQTPAARYLSMILKKANNDGDTPLSPIFTTNYVCRLYIEHCLGYFHDDYHYRNHHLISKMPTVSKQKVQLFNINRQKFDNEQLRILVVNKFSYNYFDLN